MLLEQGKFTKLKIKVKKSTNLLSKLSKIE